MDDTKIHLIIDHLRRQVREWPEPIVSQIATSNHDPFKILISTVISLRTKDEVTKAASLRLFQLAATPAAMIELTEEAVQQAIYPAGFYKVKAKNIRRICQELLNHYEAKVPDSIETLLTLPGVGRKTANLVITLGYGKMGICVDTHVHRISNRLGYVQTKNPTETEFALRAKLPLEYWIEYNDLLVTFGQNLCKPLAPRCSICPLTAYCDRVGLATPSSPRRQRAKKAGRVPESHD
jgi:endonuclease-3